MSRIRWVFFISVLALVLLGLLVLASAGEKNGLRLFNSPTYFLFQQLKWIGIAIPCMGVAFWFDYRKWREYPWLTVLAYLVVFALMGVVLLMPKVNGSSRWLQLGPMRLQPSEFAKLISVFATAVFIDRMGWRIGRFVKGTLPAVFISLAMGGLAAAEPDYGAAIVIGVTGAMVCLVGSVRFWQAVFVYIICMALVAVLVWNTPNRRVRIQAWLNSSSAKTEVRQDDVAKDETVMKYVKYLKDPKLSPRDIIAVSYDVLERTDRFKPISRRNFNHLVRLEQGVKQRLALGVVSNQLAVAHHADAERLIRSIDTRVKMRNKEFNAWNQLAQGLVAMREGGLNGLGYTNSKQKRGFLPEAHTDFIFAIGAEELGLKFSLGVILLFGLFCYCGMTIAARAADPLGRMIAYGMTFLVVSQAAANIAVVTGLAPTKGLAMPFISYGGTNLFTALIAVATLFNVARQIGLQKHRIRCTISTVSQSKE